MLVNFSRGGIVLEEDLIDALDKEQIYKYITDFPTKKLLQRLKSKKDIIIFPHLEQVQKKVKRIVPGWHVYKYLIF